jgi:5'-3' exonuclease
MGIQGYYAFLSAKYPQAIREVSLITAAAAAAAAAGTGQATTTIVADEYDHLYVDVNNFLYTSASGRDPSEERLFLRLFTCLNAILRTFPPRRTVFLAMDGPGTRYVFIRLSPLFILRCRYYARFALHAIFWGGGEI